MADGWYVLNAKDAAWYRWCGGGSVMALVENEASQIGVNLFVLGPGEPMAMYHWEDAQEDFFVLSGEAVLIADGEERPLKVWDFVHLEPKVPHTIVGVGSKPAVILAVGGRTDETREGKLGYPLDAAATKHGAASLEETTDRRVAYSRFERPEPMTYGGWLDE